MQQPAHSGMHHIGSSDWQRRMHTAPPPSPPTRPPLFPEASNTRESEEPEVLKASENKGGGGGDGDTVCILFCLQLCTLLPASGLGKKCVGSGMVHILAMGGCKRPFQPDSANLNIVY